MNYAFAAAGCCMSIRILKWGGGILLSMVVAIGLAIAAFGWNWLRGPIESRVAAATGRELTLAGDLDVGLDWPLLTLEAADVALANAEWARRPDLLRAGRIALALDIPELLRGRLALAAIDIADADLFLERRRDGERNWQLGREEAEQGRPVEAGRLSVVRSRVSYRDEAEDVQLRATVETPAGTAAEIEATGRYRGAPLRLKLVGGPLMSLRDEANPYPFSLAGDLGRTAVQARGSVTGIGRWSALDLQFEVEGANLEDLYPLFRVALPDSGPYRLAGRIAKTGAAWRAAELSGRIGDSDFSGNLQADTGGRRPVISGEVNFGKLDFADLAPAVGKKDARAAKRLPPEGAPRRVLPDERFRTERWDKADADLRLKARRIIRKGQLPLEDFSTRLLLRDAVLRLDPLEFGIAGGKLAGSIQLDGSGTPLRAEADLHARRIVFARLFPGARNQRAEVGRLSGDMKLSGAGNSPAEMLAGMNGQGGFVVSRGEVSRLMMELAGLHVLEAVVVALSGDKPIVIRCGMAAFHVKQGVLESDQFVLDTTITKIAGAGSVDFAREEVDLTLRPQAKETSFVSLRSPIHVVGPFADPDVKVDKKALVARGVGALALGAINPVLALAPLVEIGREEDSDCAKLLQEARAKAP